MILYINRFYIAMCVLRSISQYIGLMLTDDRVARWVLLKKTAGPPVCDLFICNWKRGKNDYEIVFDLFFKKKTLRIISKKGGVWGIKVHGYSKMKKY